MKTLLAVSVIAAIAIATGSLPREAAAKPGGCIKGAIVGGIAGHFAGHGGIGAAAGCAYGIHERNKYNQKEGRSGFGQNRHKTPGG